MKVRYPLAGVLAIAFAIFYFVSQGWGDLLVASSDLLFAVTSGGCALLAYLSAAKAGLKGTFALVRWGLFLGTLLWFLGELTWGIFEIALQIQIPYPSFADVFYLAGYAPIIMAITYFLYSFREAFSTRKMTIALLVGALILTLAFSVLLYPLTQSANDPLTESFDIGYPTLDTIVTILAVMMFLVYEGGLFAKPWFWISVGLMLTAIGDIMFSLGTLEGWYYSGHPTELIYLWGYIALGLGFVGSREVLR